MLMKYLPKICHYLNLTHGICILLKISILFSFPEDDVGIERGTLAWKARCITTTLMRDMLQLAEI